MARAEWGFDPDYASLPAKPHLVEFIDAFDILSGPEPTAHIQEKLSPDDGVRESLQ